MILSNHIDTVIQETKNSSSNNQYMRALLFPLLSFYLVRSGVFIKLYSD